MRRPQGRSPAGIPTRAPGFSRRSTSGAGTGSSTSRRILTGRHEPEAGMHYWLFKSEPSTFSFEMLKKKGQEGTQWDGVRNYAARNHMRAMKVGDLGFFYHSNDGLDIVGIVEIIAEAHQDSTTEDA